MRSLFILVLVGFGFASHAANIETTDCLLKAVDTAAYPVSALQPMPTPPPQGMTNYSVNTLRGELVAMNANETVVFGKEGSTRLHGSACERDRNTGVGTYVANQLKAHADSIKKMTEIASLKTQADAASTRLAPVLSACSKAFPEVASLEGSIRLSAGLVSMPTGKPSTGSRSAR